jgi:Xaa-Pro aminopeptidase
MMLPPSFHQRKVAEIQARLDAERLDGLLLLDAHNVFYASGFHFIPSERPLGLFIPRNGAPALFVPLLEQENAAAVGVSDIRTYFEYPGLEHPVVWMVKETGAQRLGIDTLTVDVFRQLPGEIVITPMVERMRWIKDAEEIALIEKAAGYADYCLELVRDHAPSIIRDGGTELDILNYCVGEARRRLRDEVGELFRLGGGSVVGTVHSGARAALPHGSPIPKRPQPGEPLIAGIGASVGGYHAESGATFLLDDARGDQLACLRAAAEVNDAAVAALRAGAPCDRVDEAARAVFDAHDLIPYVRHRIGHGMGLQSHESPWLAPGDGTTLAPGMVFSNEPGIYRPGVDGYRTINTMIVTDAAAHIPSRFLAQNPPESRILTV